MAMSISRFCLVLSAVILGALSLQLHAQSSTQAPQAAPVPETKAGSAPVATAAPPGYVMGVDDMLSIRFWGDPQLSTDVVIRTDGKVSVPLLNDVQAAGLTPEQLSDNLEKAASKFVSDP